MSSLATALKQEITRLARKEIKASTDSTRRAVAQFRRDIAELKRVVKTMERRLAALERQEKKRAGKPATPELADPISRLRCNDVEILHNLGYRPGSHRFSENDIVIA